MPRLDALIVRTVPGERKAVKWNSPFYGAGHRAKITKSGTFPPFKYCGASGKCGDVWV